MMRHAVLSLMIMAAAAPMAEAASRSPEPAQAIFAYVDEARFGTGSVAVSTKPARKPRPYMSLSAPPRPIPYARWGMFERELIQGSQASAGLKPDPSDWKKATVLIEGFSFDVELVVYGKGLEKILLLSPGTEGCPDIVAAMRRFVGDAEISFGIDTGFKDGSYLRIRRWQSGHCVASFESPTSFR